MQRCISQWIFSLGLCLVTAVAHAANRFELNMPYGASTISREIYNLHMAAFYVCVVIGVIVFGVLIYSLIKFRKSKGAVSAHFHEHLGIEILWTTIPFLILVALAVPATIVLQHIHNTDKAAITIKVTGYQWKWKYEYLDQGVSFFSNLATTQDQINNKAPKNEWFLLEVDNPVVIPVNTKVRLLITADDVVHSWWVPSLGIKQDAIPGYINENWVTATAVGTYRGQCGELCGMNHAFMPIVVKVVSQTEFNQWVRDHQPAAVRKAQAANLKPLAASVLLAEGKTQYERSCGACHQMNGEGLPPTFPPLKNSRVVKGASAANIAFVLTGVPGTAMQAFGDQLDDKTLAEIISYTRSAWGNDELVKRHKYSVIVQPMDVHRVRLQRGKS